MRNVIYGGIVLIITVFLATSELTFINGNFAAVILAAVALTALAFSALKGVALPNRDEIVDRLDRAAQAYYSALAALPEGDPERTRYRTSGAIELAVPGGITAKIPKRLLGENTLVLALICGIGYFGYQHHNANEESLRKIYEATLENTYVLSLSQQERERLNLAIPESLRRKMRRE